MYLTAIFSRFLKVAIATSNFMNEVYNCVFTLEFSVSMLKDTMALVRDYVSEARNLNHENNEFTLLVITTIALWQLMHMGT